MLWGAFKKRKYYRIFTVGYLFRIIVEETIEELLGRENIAVLDNSIHVRMEHARSYTIHCLKANTNGTGYMISFYPRGTTMYTENRTCDDNAINRVVFEANQ